MPRNNQPDADMEQAVREVYPDAYRNIWGDAIYSDSKRWGENSNVKLGISWPDAHSKLPQPPESVLETAEATPTLQDYWRCFHCDFATSNRAEAEAHFGDRDDTEEFKPLCKWWQLMSEDERIGALQDTIQQLNEAHQEAVAVCPKCNRPHYNMEDSAACAAESVLDVQGGGFEGWWQGLRIVTIATPSPLTAFEQLMRWPMFSGESFDVVRASEYDKLIAYAKGLQEQIDRLAIYNENLRKHVTRQNLRHVMDLQKIQRCEEQLDAKR